MTGARGVTVAGLALAGVTAVLWASNMPALILPMWAAFGLLFIRHRYWVGHRGWNINTALLAAAGLGSIWAILIYLPDHPLIRLALTLLIVLVWLNNRFYVFLAAKRGGMFAIAAIPFHLLYHLYNGISFAAGILLYALRRAPGFQRLLAHHSHDKPAHNP
ncbi:MAG: hypothetical protein HZB13_05210 [Acidobacteria bacterium]|nr:hypothetical protein [Acidobacteriota bacterium]